jgi:hypothetical protein
MRQPASLQRSYRPYPDDHESQTHRLKVLSAPETGNLPVAAKLIR